MVQRQRVILADWLEDGPYLVGKRVLEDLGPSFDPRNLRLYRVEGYGLLWMPDSYVGDKGETNEAFTTLAQSLADDMKPNDDPMPTMTSLSEWLDEEEVKDA